MYNTAIFILPNSIIIDERLYFKPFPYRLFDNIIRLSIARKINTTVKY